jgi:hypothetical protein
MVAGQELQISNKGGTFTVTGMSTGINAFFNTGAVVLSFTIPSGTTRFFFNDGTHWVVQ